MARFIDYDRLHDGCHKEIYKKHIDGNQNWEELWGIYCAFMNFIEIQDKHTDWDDRKKLLQPKRSQCDWSLLTAAVDGILEYASCNMEEAGDNPLKDWIADYMHDYDINPADLLMEEATDSSKRMDTLEETAKRILLRLHDAGGCDAQDDRTKGWDEAITEAIRIVEEETGTRIGEALD